LKEDHSKVFRS